MARFTGTFVPDSGSLTNDHIANTTDIDSDKLEHLHKRGTNFALAIGGTPAAREEIVYVCEAATATVRGFHALLNVDGSSTSVTFDLKKNGTTILSGVVTITNSTGDRVVVDGTISNSALVAGDVLSIQLAVSSATGASGPYAWAEIDETAG
jgi:hypothetical protein